MTESIELEVGKALPRKPWTAANLSFLLAGLGQIYCGAFRRGITYMWITGAVLLIGMVAVAFELSSAGTALVIAGVIGLLVTCISSWDAFRLARRTRAEYRLKEYNRPGVYAALCFLFFASVLGYAFILRANFIESFIMFGDSMNPTLEAGDRILVRKDVYRDSDPERNDLIVFRNPGNRRQRWVKRIVGLPGDRIEVRGEIIRVNGETLTLKTEGAEIRELVDVNLTVPENHCYVLGDHIGKSRDSRHMGPIPMIAIEGRVGWIW